DVGRRVLGPDVVNRDDVGVGERGSGPRFPLEPAQPVDVGGDGGRKDLDRHVAPEAGVPRAVDLSHAPGAERRKDLIRPEAVAGCESHGIARILSPGTGGPTPAPEPSRAPSRTSIAPVSLLVEPVDLLPVFGRKTFSPRVGRVAL